MEVVIDIAPNHEIATMYVKNHFYYFGKTEFLVNLWETKFLLLGENLDFANYKENFNSASREHRISVSNCGDTNAVKGYGKLRPLLVALCFPCIASYFKIN